ncbi:Conidiation protein 6-domain-containing protein [Abortiporus biennis]|nr:Conidiation protein 6-domain-containing protein [Abortiporus biennis]
MSDKNPGNVARGYKATMSNPNTSDSAKQHAQETLEKMKQSGEIDSEEAHAGQVERGHKAAMKNPNVSGDAKEHSKHILDDM